MKGRIRTGLFWACWLAATVNLQGQNGITIGTIGASATVSWSSPISHYNEYSAAEMLYLASEVNTSGYITRIEFYKGNGDHVVAEDVTIYLKTTTASILTSPSSLTGYTQVYNGQFSSVGHKEWKGVTLQVPFQYTPGSGNLSVLIVRGRQQPVNLSQSPRYYYTTTGSDNRNAQYGGALGGTTPWVSGQTPMTLNNRRPNIRLFISAEPSAVCAVPDNFRVSDISQSTAVLSWSLPPAAASSEYEWIIMTYLGEPRAEHAIASGRVAHPVSSVLVTGLSGNSGYTAYLRSICGTTASDWIISTKFATLVGIEEPEASRFRFHPNPVDDLLYITADKHPGPAGITLMDLSGRQLFNAAVPSPGIPVDLSGFPAGIYLLQFQAGDQHITRKLIKQ